MEIRLTGKDYKKLKGFNKVEAKLTKDDSIDASVIMIQDNEGKLIEWTRGFNNIKSFITKGYVGIRKNCPYRIGKCIGAKCSLYVIKNYTGDCAHIWNTIQ